MTEELHLLSTLFRIIHRVFINANRLLFVSGKFS